MADSLAAGLEWMDALDSERCSGGTIFRRACGFDPLLKRGGFREAIWSSNACITYAGFDEPALLRNHMGRVHRRSRPFER